MKYTLRLKNVQEENEFVGTCCSLSSTDETENVCHFVGRYPILILIFDWMSQNPQNSRMSKNVYREKRFKMTMTIFRHKWLGIKELDLLFQKWWVWGQYLQVHERLKAVTLDFLKVSFVARFVIANWRNTFCLIQLFFYILFFFTCQSVGEFIIAFVWFQLLYIKFLFYVCYSTVSLIFSLIFLLDQEVGGLVVSSFL